MSATTLRIKELEQFTVINDVGTKMGIIRRTKMSKTSPKEYSWVLLPELRNLTHKELSELSELVKKYDDREPLKLEAPEERHHGSAYGHRDY